MILIDYKRNVFCVGCYEVFLDLGEDRVGGGFRLN